MYDPQHAWQLVTEHTQSESLRNHMRAVAAAMRAYARRFDEDEERWATVGLLHDFDYEENPDISTEGHPLVGVRLLREQGWPEEICRAILSHAESITGVAPETKMERTLVAVDELTGLITAVALVRPSKDIRDVKPKSIKKKWKDQRFAAGVDRQEIEHATERLGVPLNEHIQVVLNAMQEEAEALGLDGSLAS
ncbi:MAG: HDIG domain-containing protein [Chloroflexota bacterium]|nr:HDIG domain-containing protein [Chloroflexota bacterium]